MKFFPDFFKLFWVLKGINDVKDQRIGVIKQLILAMFSNSWGALGFPFTKSDYECVLFIYQQMLLNVGSSCNQLFSEVVGRGKYPLCNSQHISWLHLKILVDANYLNTRLWHLLRDYCLNFLWTSNLLGLFQSKKLIQMKRYFASIVHHQNGWSSIPSLSESAGTRRFF